MTTETKPAWVAELRRKLVFPLTPEELVARRRAAAEIERLAREEPLPPGTYERLLDLAYEEDVARGVASRDHLKQDGA